MLVLVCFSNSYWTEVALLTATNDIKLLVEKTELPVVVML